MLKGYKAPYFGHALKLHILVRVLSAVLIIFQHIVDGFMGIIAKGKGLGSHPLILVFLLSINA